MNQGWVSGARLLWKYIADMGRYLKSEYGVVLSDQNHCALTVTNDHILFSDTQQGFQNLLNGLQNVCKTNVMCFDKPLNPDVYFNEKNQVATYRYLGIIIDSVHRCNQDIFAKYHQCLRNQARKAICNLHIENLKPYDYLPLMVMFYMFDMLIRPILTYGSDIWESRQSVP